MLPTKKPRKNRFLLALLICSTSICLISLFLMFRSGAFQKAPLKPLLCESIQQQDKSFTIEDMITLPGDQQLLLLRSDRLALSQQKAPEASFIEMFDLKTKTFYPLSFKGPHGQFRGIGMNLYQKNNIIYLFVVNYRNERSSIDRFQLNIDDKELIFEASYTDPLIQYPRSVIAFDTDRFFVLNEFGLYTSFGHMIEDTFGLRKSYGAYFDGKAMSRVIDNLKHATSAAWDADKHLLYLVEQGSKKIKSFQGPEESWKPQKDFDGFKDFSGIPDQIKIDPKGNLWLSVHYDGIALKSYSLKPLEEKAPSSVYFFNPEKDLLQHMWTSEEGPVFGADHALAVGSYLMSSSVFAPQIALCALE